MKAGWRQPEPLAAGPVPGLLEVAPWVLSNACPLPQPLRSCLLALSSFGGPNSRGIFPSVATLAGRYGCKERSARSHLRLLEKRGLLSSSPTERQGSRFYTLHVDALRHLCASKLSAPEDAEALLKSGMPASSDDEATHSARWLLVGKPDATDAAVREGELSARGEPSAQEPQAGDPLDPDAVRAGLLGAVFTPGESDAPASQPAGRQELPGGTEVTLASRQELPAEPSPMPTPRQKLPADQAEVAAELLHPICSMEPEKTGEREARPPALKESPELVEQPAAVAPAREAARLSLQLAPREVALLWSTAWAARHRASYTPDRQDQDRFRWLAQLASDRAHERAEAVRTAGLPVPGPIELMRQYLTLLFAAFLADPGRSTGRDGEKYLVSVRHPLRCLEQDVGRLRVLWPALPVAVSAEAAGMAPGGPGEGRGPGLVSTRRPQLAAGSEPMPARPQMPTPEVAAQLRALGLGFRGRGVGAPAGQPRERGVA